MASHCEASTPERTREAIRSRVENAGISSRPLCRTTSSADGVKNSRNSRSEISVLNLRYAVRSSDATPTALRPTG